MCISPLWTPFIALPLAEEWQWSHGCDSLAGDAILHGQSYNNKSSTVSLDFKPRGNMTRNFRVNYTMSQPDPNSDSNAWTLDLVNETQIPPELLPVVESISYNGNKAGITLFANCWDISGNLTTRFPCLAGNIGFDHLSLNFTFNGSLVTTETKFLADHKEWRWSSDAPSFALRRVLNGQPAGDIVLRTVVTQRNYCQFLKACLGYQASILDLVVPLGLALKYQDEYASYCKRERLRLF